MAGVIDWCQIRQNMIETAHRRELYNPRYWNTEVAAFKENTSHWSELTEQQLKILPLSKELTILDVGAGTGRMTLPMAKKVKQVTALEPAQKMFSVLKENAQAQGISNISYVNKSLEDLALSGQYDLVVASFSLFMYDIKSALQKMDTLAKRAVYLFLSASPWLDEALQKAVYDTSSPWSDFIFIYNTLYAAGIFANVEICNYTIKQSFTDYEEAAAKFMQTNRIPPEKKDPLTAYLHTHLVEENGKLLSIRKRKAAAIWWTKNQ
jgi:ubiquinone/menaquinone biosynthesis C-methylase UbiE